MSPTKIDIASINLDENGRAVLSDTDLGALAESYQFTLAGGNGQTNEVTCANSAHCGGSSNGSCTNAAGACGNTFNVACREGTIGIGDGG
jgi:hypothetical protein